MHTGTRMHMCVVTVGGRGGFCMLCPSSARALQLASLQGTLRGVVERVPWDLRL